MQRPTRLPEPIRIRHTFPVEFQRLFSVKALGVSLDNDQLGSLNLPQTRVQGFPLVESGISVSLANR